MTHITIKSVLPLLALVVMVISVTAHEVAHGLAAHVYGDSTAKKMGRLSLSPIRHLDPLGSIFIPIILFLMGSQAMFGGAKPVPVKYETLNKWQKISVAAAGIAANLFLVLLALLLFYITRPIGVTTSPLWVQAICVFIFYFIPINLILAFLNMMPLPCFDGWMIIACFFGSKQLFEATWLKKPQTILVSFLIAALLIKINLNNFKLLVQTLTQTGVPL